MRRVTDSKTPEVKKKRRKVGLRLRFRTRRDLDEVRRAASIRGQSMNAYIVSHIVAQARTHLSYRDEL